MRSLLFLCLVANTVLADQNGQLDKRAGVVPSLSGRPVDMTSGGGGTYPRANFLSDGSILGAYTATSGGNSVLTLVSSTNQGSSWSRKGTAATRPTASSNLDNPYPLQLPSGRILLAYRNHDKDPNNHTPNYHSFYRITISYSDDGGASWLFLADAATKGAGTIGLWEPFLRNAQDGSLQLYYSEENASNDQDNKMRTSTDGGKTWSVAKTISGDGVTARDGMVGVATISGRNLIAVFESQENGLFTVKSVTSSDDGVNWGNRRPVYTPTGTNNNAGAPQVVNVGGTLCVSFMTDEDTQLHNWINGAGSKLITSGNSGSSWGNKIQVFAPQANWPGLLSLDGSSLLFMADSGGAKAQKIVLS
ncbi:Sialidase [Xylogone sp. PMI_703]|nr:Sialidase [Xylogone sp. PMI_703]